MIAIVELHATTSGHGLRKPQFNSNANLQSERPGKAVLSSYAQIRRRQTMQ